MCKKNSTCACDLENSTVALRPCGCPALQKRVSDLYKLTRVKQQVESPLLSSKFLNLELQDPTASSRAWES